MRPSNRRTARRACAYRRRWTTSFPAAVAIGAAIACTSAGAAQRTFVASYGSDLNACSRVLPCRSFAVAIAQTDDGGEIVVLDSAGYGSVVVTKSIALIAPGGVYAGISAFAGQSAVTIDGASIRVTLRGLHLNGFAGSNSGIDYTLGAVLHVERCIISGFDNQGIEIGAAGEIFVSDTSIRKISGEAIDVRFVHSPNVARLTIARTHLASSTHGVYVYANAKVLLSDSVVANNTFNAVAASGPNGDDLAEVVVDQTALVGNGTGVYVGIVPGALGTHRIIVDGSSIAWNSTGWNARNDANTDLYTRGNNVLHFNNNDANGKAAVAIGGS